MKIALLTLNYLPSSGGLVSYVRNFSKYLLDSGHQVDIYCSHEKQSMFLDVEEFERATIYRVKALNVPILLKPLTPIYIVKKFRQFFTSRIERLKDYDLIVVRHVYLAWALRHLGLNCVFVSPLISPKLVIINSRKESLIKRLYSYLIVPQLLGIEWQVAKSIPLAVLSKSKAIELKRFFHLKDFPLVTYPGVNEERFNLIGSYSSNKEDKSSLKLVSVCRLVEEKNLDLVISAVGDLVHNYGLSLSYQIVGDGPLLEHLKVEAKKLKIDKYVDFVGYTEKPEMYLKHNELFVMPSTYEGFGHVYLEANACGLPVIAISSEADGVTVATDEILDHEVNGFIMAKNKKEDLIEAINLYISQRNQKNWGIQCSKFVSERFSWNSHLSKLLGLRDAI